MIVPNWFDNNKLKELRKNHKYTQTYVADKIGCVLKSYQNYENGKVGIPLEFADKLASLYNVSIDYLIGRSEHETIELSALNAHLPLSDSAIKSLLLLTHNNKTVNSYQLSFSHILNFILQDTGRCMHLLDNLLLYLDNDFDTPIHFDGQAYVPNRLSNGNIEKEILIARKNESGEIESFKGVGTDILETYALDLLRNQLYEMKKEYKKGENE